MTNSKNKTKTDSIDGLNAEWEAARQKANVKQAALSPRPVSTRSKPVGGKAK